MLVHDLFGPCIKYPYIFLIWMKWKCKFFQQELFWSSLWCKTSLGFVPMVPGVNPGTYSLLFYHFLPNFKLSSISYYFELLHHFDMADRPKKCCIYWEWSALSMFFITFYFYFFPTCCLSSVGDRVLLAWCASVIFIQLK